MSRDDAWLRRLAEIYFDEALPVDISLDDDDPRCPDDNRRGDVLIQVFRLPRDEPEECWRFIQIACALPLSEDQLGLLRAGVLEDLMDAHGSDFLDRVEAAAKESAAMQTVVDAVWTMSMDAYVARAFKTIQSHRASGAPNVRFPPIPDFSGGRTSTGLPSEANLTGFADRFLSGFSDLRTVSDDAERGRGLMNSLSLLREMPVRDARGSCDDPGAGRPASGTNSMRVVSV